MPHSIMTVPQRPVQVQNFASSNTVHQTRARRWFKCMMKPATKSFTIKIEAVAGKHVAAHYMTHLTSCVPSQKISISNLPPSPVVT